MSTAVASPEQQEGFEAWLPTHYAQYVRVHKHRQWYCIAIDFDVTGSGATLDAALADMAGLLRAYLYSCFAAGMSYDAARRPIPPRLLPKEVGVHRWLRHALRRLISRPRRISVFNRQPHDGAGAVLT